VDPPLLRPRSVEAQQRTIAHEIVKNRRLAHKIVQMAERVLSWIVVPFGSFNVIAMRPLSWARKLLSRSEAKTRSPLALIHIFERSHRRDNILADIRLGNKKRVRRDFQRPNLAGGDYDVNRRPPVSYRSGNFSPSMEPGIPISVKTRWIS
jgi:hypothetical protein